MALHGEATVGNVHIIYNWTYADATAREAASGLVAGDVGKFSRQLDDDTIWMLTDDDPVTWIAIQGMTNPMTTQGDIVYGGASGTPTRLAKGTATQVLAMNAGATAPEWVTGGGGGLYSAYVCIQDRKSQNTAGGTFTAGDWRTRTLNTEAADTGNHASVASNQISLAAGTYRVRASAPALAVLQNQARIYNITDSAVLQDTSGNDLVGSTQYAGVNTYITQTESIIVGRFTIAGTKTLELQHKSAATKADNGFGVAANLATEIYAVVEFWKES